MPTETKASRWLRCYRRRRDFRARLFCFPYAGAGVTAYSSWPEYLPEDIEVYG
jgi:medium-chain acyl-[acyl-carrier-protein] hydrolase